MGNRALCVGINHYPIDGADLNGCVNDAKAWAKLLIDHFDFAPSDVTLVLDDRATKKAMVAGLEDLIAGAKTGDVLVFTNSSHGSQVPDRDRDERDRWDEILCPYDVKDNPLLDDELREILDGVPEGVRMTVVSDSCHSGSATRALSIDDILRGVPRDGRRPRYLNRNLLKDTPAFEIRGARPRPKGFPQAGMKHVFLAGCKDDEVSYDAMIDGDYHGAMTYFAIKAVTDADYRITYEALQTRTLALITEQYGQHPRLEGPAKAKGRQIFT